jgi:hypothetical protein
MDLISFAIKTVKTVERIDKLLTEKPKSGNKSVKSGKKVKK